MAIDVRRALLWTAAAAWVVSVWWAIPSAQRVNGVTTPSLGATTVTTLDTGQGANELYDMDQNVLTTSTPSFDAVTIGPTDGVTLSDDGDGALIITGAGTGSDESLTWNFDDTSNVVVVASSSGVATLYLSSIAFSTPRHVHQVQSVTVDGATTFAITSDYVALACTGAETINTITGGVQGDRLLIDHGDTECTLADDNAATASNAIDLTGTGDDIGAVNKVIVLYYNGVYWLEVSESDN